MQQHNPETVLRVLVRLSEPDYIRVNHVKIRYGDQLLQKRSRHQLLSFDPCVGRHSCVATV
jgi:hypothetical protein